MSGYFLELKNASKTFDAVRAMDGVDFDVIKGEVHCLIGQNGCGKSTLIKVLSGVHRCEGDYALTIKDKKMKQFSPRDAMKQGIQVIYQDLSLFPNLTVAENIAYIVSSQNKGVCVSRKKQRKIAQKAMEMICVSLPLDELVENLPIAQRQLVAMCRALATDGELIIMDEPTSSLTNKEIKNLFSVIMRLKDKGISIIFVSHKLDEIFEIADRVTVMRDGRMIGTFQKNELDIQKMAYYISGQDVAYTQPRSVYNEPVVLEARGLSSPGKFTDVSFALRKGEVLGVIGLLGAGRTELALALFGMEPASCGSILIEGKEVKIAGIRDAVKNGIGYIPEDRLLQGIVLDQDVEMNTTVTVLDRIRNKFHLIDKKKSEAVTDRWIDSLHVKCGGRDVKLKTLSGGNQQKVVLGKWLATDPKILILDEPTNGVDIAAKGAIYQIIRELTEKGLGVIFISSEVPEIYNNSHRIAIMKGGKIVGVYNRDAITEEEVDRLATAE